MLLGGLSDREGKVTLEVVAILGEADQIVMVMNSEGSFENGSRFAVQYRDSESRIVVSVGGRCVSSSFCGWRF